MKISPMDLQRQTFSQKLRGFDPAEVRTYLNIVAEEIAALQRERDGLEHEVQSLRGLVDEHRQRETILKNTLLTAQRLSEEIKDAARKQSESVVKEAEMQADRTDVRALITRLTHILDLQEEAEVEDNLRFLKRREEGR
jgi:cell division initiation protein